MLECDYKNNNQPLGRKIKGGSTVLAEQKKTEDSRSAASLPLAGLYAKKAQAEQAKKIAGLQVGYIDSVSRLQNEVRKAQKNIGICTTQLARLRAVTSTPKIIAEIIWFENYLENNERLLKEFQQSLSEINTVFTNEEIPVPDMSERVAPRIK